MTTLVDKTNHRFLWKHANENSRIFVRKNVNFNDPLMNDIAKKKYDNFDFDNYFLNDKIRDKYFGNHYRNNIIKIKDIKFEKIPIDGKNDDTDNYINNIFRKKYARYLVNHLGRLQWCYATFCLLDEIFNVCNVLYIDLSKCMFVMINDNKIFFVFYYSLKYLCLNLNDKHFDFDVRDKKEIDMQQIVDSVILRLGKTLYERNEYNDDEDEYDGEYDKYDDDDDDDDDEKDIISFKPNKDIEMQISNDSDLDKYMNWRLGIIDEFDKPLYVRQRINFNCDLWNIYKIKKNIDNEENIMKRDENNFANLCRGLETFANVYSANTLCILYNIISIDFRMKQFLCMDKIYNSKYDYYFLLFKVFNFDGELVIQYTTFVDQIYSISANDVIKDFMMYIYASYQLFDL